MKQYFAKYLPVEGEPKEGDMTILAGEIAPYNKIVPIGLKAGKSELIYQKVKLFLCSRDTQVGDELTHIVSGRKGKYCTSIGAGGSGWIFIDGTSYMYNRCRVENWIKVIGEISSGTNIQDGQEFTEEEVKSLTII